MISVRRRTLRLMLASSVAAVLIGAVASPPPAVSGDETAALAAALSSRGLSSTAGDVVFLSGPNAGLSRRLAFVLARRGTEPRDLFTVEARVAPGGRVLALGAITNVSRSIGADEAELVVHAPWAAYATVTEAGVAAVTLLDTRGEDPRLTQGWSSAWRLANRIKYHRYLKLLKGVRPPT